jgi:hypothetical protein
MDPELVPPPFKKHKESNEEVRQEFSIFCHACKRFDTFVLLKPPPMITPCHILQTMRAFEAAMPRSPAAEAHDARSGMNGRQPASRPSLLNMHVYNNSPQRQTAIQAFQAATQAHSPVSPNLSQQQQNWLQQQAAIQQATRLQQANIQAFKHAITAAQNKAPRLEPPRLVSHQNRQTHVNGEANHENLAAARMLAMKPVMRKKDETFDLGHGLGAEHALLSLANSFDANAGDSRLHCVPEASMPLQWTKRKRERICFTKEEKQAVLNFVREGISACSTNMKLNNLYKEAARLLTTSATEDLNHDARIVKNLVKKSRVKGDTRLKSAFNRISNTKGRAAQFHERKNSDESDGAVDDDEEGAAKLEMTQSSITELRSHMDDSMNDKVAPQDKSEMQAESHTGFEERAVEGGCVSEDLDAHIAHASVGSTELPALHHLVGNVHMQHTDSASEQAQMANEAVHEEPITPNLG